VIEVIFLFVGVGTGRDLSLMGWWNLNRTGRDLSVHDLSVHDLSVHDLSVHDLSVHDLSVHDLSVQNLLFGFL